MAVLSSPPSGGGGQRCSKAASEERFPERPKHAPRCNTEHPPSCLLAGPAPRLGQRHCVRCLLCQSELFKSRRLFASGNHLGLILGHCLRSVARTLFSIRFWFPHESDANLGPRKAPRIFRRRI